MITASTRKVISLLDKITEKYGQSIIDGPERDWGQIICRMELGPDWGNHPEFSDPSRPDEQDISNCERLLCGEWPEWIVRSTKGRENDQILEQK